LILNKWGRDHRQIKNGFSGLAIRFINTLFIEYMTN